jgi:hypothetical protein
VCFSLVTCSADSSFDACRPDEESGCARRESNGGASSSDAALRPLGSERFVFYDAEDAGAEKKKRRGAQQAQRVELQEVEPEAKKPKKGRQKKS